MKIKHLIKKLQKLNPELEIVLASSSSGNSCNLLNEISDFDGFLFDNDAGIFLSKEEVANVPVQDRKFFKKVVTFYP